MEKKFASPFSVEQHNSLIGFTLTELLIAISIITLLVVIAMPRFGRMVRKSKEAASKGNLGALRSAISIYYSDHAGIWPWQLAKNILPTACWNMKTPAGGLNLNLNHNALVPYYIEKIPNCYSGQGSAWGTNVAGDHRHEGGNWLEISDSTRFTYGIGAHHNWDCEWLYYRDTGEIWINCRLRGLNGESISSW